MTHSHPERRFLRLTTFDYGSSSAYFCTLCAHQRRPHFNRPIVQVILEEQWDALPARYAGVQLDSFVIMPDHIHCILWLDAETPGCPKLGHVIGGYKSLVCGAWLRFLKAAGENYPGALWQRGYYDRIIRSESDLLEKRIYIQNNPEALKLKCEGKKKNILRGQ